MLCEWCKKKKATVTRNTYAGDVAHLCHKCAEGDWEGAWKRSQNLLGKPRKVVRSPTAVRATKQRKPLEGQQDFEF